jgi:hypothetical protein
MGPLTGAEKEASVLNSITRGSGKEMRDDLLDAHAAVDWARTEISILDQEFKSWFESSPYLIVEDLHPEMGSKFFKLQVNRKPPNTLNAGVGAVINSVWTGLDLLASTLAAHNGVSAGSDTHFPIYATAEDFIDPKNVAQRKAWLSAAQGKIIEELKPYRGGNDLLFALRQLEILRKRGRVIDVHLAPGAVMHTPEAEAAGFRVNPKWPGFEDGAVLGGANINSATSGFDIVVDIKFNEADLVSSQPVIATLHRFVALVDEIIKRFDTAN